jgi:hypothetical protein
MKFALLMLFMTLSSAGSALAFDTGNEFLKECEPGTTKGFTQLSDQEQLFGMACAGYMRGFIGGIRVAEAGTGKRMICSPSGIDTLEAMRISVKWMNSHKDDLNRPAVELILRSMSDAFPCSDSGTPPRPEEHDRLSL